MIVVDDGSTDGSADLFKRLLPKAIVVCQSNAGVGAARNHGAEIAEGEFIQFLDADDTIEVGKLDCQSRFAQAIGADVVYSGWRMVVVEDGAQRSGEWMEGEAESEIVAALLGGWWFPTVAALVRRTAYQAVGGCDVALKNTCDDFHVWAQLAIAGYRYAYAPGRWANYYRYVHVRSLSRSNRKQFLEGEATIINNAVKELSRRDALSTDRRCAAARRLYSVAQNVAPFDWGGYIRLRETVYDLDPQFTPAGSRTFELATKFFGVTATEMIASFKRRLRRAPAGTSS